MMAINVLMVNYDTGMLELYNPLLAQHGVKTRPASTMREALDLLVEEKYSGVVINADDFAFPLLFCIIIITAFL